MSGWLKILFLGVAIGALVVLNLFRYDEPIATEPLIANSKSSETNVFTDEIEATQSVEQLAELQFIQTFSRPLFSENRKKYVKPVAVKKKAPAKPVAKKAAPPKPLPKIRILGISISNGTKRTLVKLPKQPAAKWFEKGSKIDGWEVVEISSHAVKIANANREVSIALFPKTQ